MNLPEGHLHRHSNFHLFRHAVGHYTIKSAAPVQIDNTEDIGQIRDHGDFVEAEGKNRAFPMGELNVIDLILGMAFGANSLSGVLDGATFAAFATGKRKNLV